MKRSILFLVIVLLSNALCSAQSLNEQVNKAYAAKEYGKAISMLEAEAAKQKKDGLESPQLYYNLGNAYFRSNNIAKAMLYYERALLLNPGDRDTRANIEFARTKIEDKFADKGDFFLSDWYNGIRNLASSNTWSNISIGLFIVFLLCLSLFLFDKRVIVKQTVFYTGIVIIVLFVFCNLFAFRHKYNIENRNTAIIMAGAVSAYSAPNAGDKEVFTLHAGSKVEILKKDGNWVEIEIISGDVGWVEADKLEII
ncbi:tetratricopeptide (TPR) repeat protein [Dysgonomonas sp. PH5-45]|uniref:SH3 domain-containing protein n=1 Tax=unclassified Dysgonomonas TaxID=2630389 RepID=UPI0024761651|nr:MULTISPECIES: tetratricopeptide repeat protein [unclassified Dysgonomonas]MDH6355556.1 tetratricopeptide (TPR) repeat protein [Dysgonomonas sp. PH5-45]MDH6388453.1 tetratricopeptide (TPR) repeat protein [Dysgonomonas sp. PH5-37]